MTDPTTRDKKIEAVDAQVKSLSRYIVALMERVDHLEVQVGELVAHAKGRSA